MEPCLTEPVEMRQAGYPMPSRFGVLARPRRPTWSRSTASSPMSIRQSFADSRASHHGNRDSSSIRSVDQALDERIWRGQRREPVG